MNEAVNIPTEIVSPVMERGVPVSSSRIRAAIAIGDLVEASVLLGRNFVLDVRSLPHTPEEDAVGYDARAMRRITPPNGRYPAIVTHDDDSKRNSVDVSIRDGVVFIPKYVGAVSGVEFLPWVARSE
jgi:FAD synthase